MAVVVYGTLEKVMRVLGIKSSEVINKQRAQDKLDQANRKINRRLDKANITKPTSGEGFDFLGDVANDWAACLFQQEVHGKARQGRSQGFLQSANVLCERAESALNTWIMEELDMGSAIETKFDWARIEGEGIKEEVND